MTEIKTDANNSEDYKLQMSKLGSSLITWSLIFFYGLPMLWVLPQYFLNKDILSSWIGMFLYLPVNVAMAFLAVKWKNKLLLNKSLKVHQIYIIVCSLIGIIVMSF